MPTISLKPYRLPSCSISPLHQKDVAHPTKYSIIPKLKRWTPLFQS
ncbi:MAG: hypothetical protein KAI83_14000 [Thiomargarita sp.]|nr:hypothetical protein [Thiomargarita sp.]